MRKPVVNLPVRKQPGQKGQHRPYKGVDVKGAESDCVIQCQEKDACNHDPKTIGPFPEYQCKARNDAAGNQQYRGRPLIVSRAYQEHKPVIGRINK